MQLYKNGVLEKHGVEMIGARADVIAKAEEREQLSKPCEKIGLDTCRGRMFAPWKQAWALSKKSAYLASFDQASHSG